MNTKVKLTIDFPRQLHGIWYHPQEIRDIAKSLDQGLPLTYAEALLLEALCYIIASKLEQELKK